MAAYKIVFTKRAQKDAAKLDAVDLRERAHALLTTIAHNPYELPYEKLHGDLQGLYSRRINVKHRLVYEVHEDAKTIVVRAMWTHYE